MKKVVPKKVEKIEVQEPLYQIDEVYSKKDMNQDAFKAKIEANPT